MSYNIFMKKSVLIGGGVLVLVVAWLAVVACSKSWWSLSLWPASIRHHFVLNANIIPASDKSRAQYVAINPGWRAEFGDKQNPTSAYVRFEKTAGGEQTSRDVDRNLLDQLAVAALVDGYQPGVQWQIFSVGVDETQLSAGTSLAADEEVFRLSRELLGEQLIASDESDLQEVAAAVEKIKSETVLAREQGYDVVSNLAVADNVDLAYTVVPERGITSKIIIGDRENFDTACLKFLSLTGSDTMCQLPPNKFSFLLQLDDLQQLVHSPLAIDGSDYGTYYVTDEKQEFVLRLNNFAMQDSSGASAPVQVEVRPGQIDGQEVDGYYIVTLTANLSWLIDSARQFPVTITGGFGIDGADFFAGEKENNSYLWGQNP